MKRQKIEYNSIRFWVKGFIRLTMIHPIFIQKMERSKLKPLCWKCNEANEESIQLRAESCNDNEFVSFLAYFLITSTSILLLDLKNIDILFFFCFCCTKKTKRNQMWTIKWRNTNSSRPAFVFFWGGGGTKHGEKKKAFCSVRIFTRPKNTQRYTMDIYLEFYRFQISCIVSKVFRTFYY